MKFLYQLFSFPRNYLKLILVFIEILNNEILVLYRNNLLYLTLGMIIGMTREKY